MGNEVIFYTQIVSIIGYVGAVFGLYRLLVSAKDSKIGLLEERIKARDDKIKELEAQTPDALAKALTARIEIMSKELERMLADDSGNKEEIRQKEGELLSIKHQLDKLTALIRDSDLVCPKCGAPLSQRATYPISGYVDGREIDADTEFVEYECGLVINDGRVQSPCQGQN